MNGLRFIVYSDYLCPWCFNASVRLRRLEEEYAGDIALDWRSYLLRPEPRRSKDPQAALEKFRRYSQSWEVPGSEEDSGDFTVWASDEPPPSHSVPAHRAAKAAKAIGEEAFRVFHDRLMGAYFTENRDISSEQVQRELWAEVDLPEPAWKRSQAPEVLQAILAEHEEARSFGATGVPAVRRDDNPAIIVGAHPVALYRRWIERSLARAASGLGEGAQGR
ncbi:MAG: DsbA family protein [Myxococcota bacterium]|nr:DsbA family protein [Myxococcota bacterium]